MGPAAEQLADALAQDANNMKLLSGDPVKAALSRLEGAEHRDMLQASMILFQRFCDTETLPELGKLSSIVRESMQPTLAKFEKHLTTRRAFQAASTLTPLLSRAATLATQCCALAIRGPWSHGVVLPFCEAVSDLAEVFNVAIMARAELCRPFDAPRIYASHRRFADLEATASRAVSMCSPAAGNISRTLAPLPPKPEHHWRYDQLRQFWSSSCSHKFLDGAVPIDELAILLLQAAGAEVSLAYREALMRRLHGASLRFPGKVCADELDCCSAEIRRNGGLKAWVHAVVLGGDLSKTAALKGGSTVSPRPGERPFLLTATLRKPETESSLTDVVAQGLLKASQRLILGDKVSPDSRDAHGDTALHLAASLDFKHGSLGALLLSNGADINAQDRYLATPLHKAAAGQSNLAKELVKNGADVGREDRWRSTPLHKAAEHGKAELASLLLSEGAGISADEWGDTPLHRAVHRGQLAVVETLLANGGDANAEDRRGDKPLHLAATRGDYALVKLLLQHGGEARALNRVGKMPEECARDRGHSDVVTLLQHRDEWVPLAATI